MTEPLRVEERYGRRDRGTMQNVITYHDDKVFSRPWTLTQDWLLAPGVDLMEHYCENNRYPEHVR